MGIDRNLFEKLSNYLSRETNEDRHAYLCDFDRICHEIIPGDVLLVEGTNRISKIIKRMTHSPWTHAALYIGQLHNIEDSKLRQLMRQHYHGSPAHQLVIESIIGEGTIIRPVNVYRDYHIRICRPSGLSRTDAQKVIGYAIMQLGNRYSIRHIMDLARFIVANRLLPRRWKSVLFAEEKPGQASQDICSAMIASAFTAIDFPILPVIKPNDEQKLEMIHRNPKLFTPSDFDYSPYFSIIKSPIYPFHGRSHYRHLPWRDDLISHDDGVISSTSVVQTVLDNNQPN